MSESAKVALSDESTGLVVAMRQRTRELHTLAERSGYVSQMLHGRGSLRGYLMLLRNLLPAYEELERGLERHRGASVFAGVPWASLYRSRAIEHDLRGLAGIEWRDAIHLLPSGQSYAHRIGQAAADNGEKLIAHAYTRYMGDLSGGQVIKRLLGKSLGLGHETLSFYDFPEISDIAAFKLTFRTSVDIAATSMDDVGSVVEEAAIAFQLNIELSNEIETIS